MVACRISCLPYLAQVNIYWTLIVDQTKYSVLMEFSNTHGVSLYFTDDK